jgi:hypothetical protein
MVFFSNIPHARSRDRRIEGFRITLPANQKFANAASKSIVWNFIYFVFGTFRDANRRQFFTVEMSIYLRLVLIFQLIDGARCPITDLFNLKNFRGVILFTAFREPHFFTDSDVLAHSQFCFAVRIVLRFSLILFHIASTSESVTFDGAISVDLCTELL